MPPPPAPSTGTVRVHLAPEILGPLCHILGHVIFRAGRMPVSEGAAASRPAGASFAWTQAQEEFMTGGAASRFCIIAQPLCHAGFAQGYEQFGRAPLSTLWVWLLLPLGVFACG